MGSREETDSGLARMTDLILLLQADHDIQAAFGRYEDYQEGRGEVFMRQLDAVLTLLRQHPELAPVYAGPYRRHAHPGLSVRRFLPGTADAVVVAYPSVPSDAIADGELALFDVDSDAVSVGNGHGAVARHRFFVLAARRLASRFGPTRGMGPFW